VSLDALDPAMFRQLSGGRGNIEDVFAGIDAAQAAGFRSIKINCVVQRGLNDDQALAVAERFRGTPHVPRFIEYMDVGNCNGWRREGVVPSAELRDRIHARWPLRALTPTYRGEVATRHGYADGAGEVGFVSSVSDPFCGDCHRARLSADGQLFTCLFATRGQPLREHIGRGEDALADHLAGLWRLRADRYSEQRASAPAERKKIEMFYIGG
jgi:cyclic pyranopterin phosphate synthase